jgi:hypothetical protein
MNKVLLKQNILNQKLETFIKKYYKNQLLKGGILALSLMVFIFASITFLEYIGRFGSNVRFVMYVLSILSALFLVVVYLVRPLLGLSNISRKIDSKSASKIIGAHFPNINDKLLNTLQLQEKASKEDSMLLHASIDQKVNELSPIPFTNAINYRKNLPYIKYALLPALAIIAIFLISPAFKNSSTRIVKYNETFIPEAPFDFLLINENLNAIQNEDIKIDLSLRGKKIPNEAYIKIGNHQYKMPAANKVGDFSYEIKNIQHSQKIQFLAAGYESEFFDLEVLLKPQLTAFQARLDFPKYLNRTSEVTKSIGMISVPLGTTITWFLETQNVESLAINRDKKFKNKNNRWKWSKRFLKSEDIAFSTKNSRVAKGDSIRYQIVVTDDAYPSITAESKMDSLSSKVVYFMGNIEDDYGFSKMEFHYLFKNGEKAGKKFKTAIKINPSTTKQNFFHYWDLEEIDVKLEDEIEYYFMVWDNDGVRGPKATKSLPQTYKAPSIAEIEAATKQANEVIKKDLSNALSQSEKNEKELKSIEKMLTEKKSLDWNEKKKIKDYIERQRELEKNIEKLIQQNKEKTSKEVEFKPQHQHLFDKQEKLQEMMENILDEETKKLLEELEKLLDQNNKDEIQKKMDQLKMNEQEMNKELDRMMELFKELELEKLAQETVDKLKELAEQQKKLAEETQKSNDKSQNDSLQNKQEDLNKKFEDIKKDIEELKQKNEELETPKNINPSEEKQDQIDSEMKKSSDQLNKGNKNDASKNQKNAGEKMDEMADDLQGQIDEAYEEQQGEDYDNLRQILENLIQLSHDQEDVLTGFKQIKSYGPKFIELNRKQRKIKDETRLVEDSLQALAKRVMEIQKFVNDEIIDLNRNIDRSLYELAEQRNWNALVYQQRAMTNFNNLALMLSESLKQMQEQMKEAQKSKGKGKPKPGQCKKPGEGKGGKNSKPNASSLKKMQEELAKKLEQLKQGQQQGQNPSSREFAETAAQQAALRKQLRELENQLKKEGKGGSLGNLKQTQDMMDEVEKDLYNKRLNSQTLHKLKQIEIKLSEHEKAQQEQEQDEKRKSNEGKDMRRELPPSIQKYLDEKNREVESLKTVSPELQPYYDNKVKSYFR